MTRTPKTVYVTEYGRCRVGITPDAPHHLYTLPANGHRICLKCGEDRTTDSLNNPHAPKEN